MASYVVMEPPEGDPSGERTVFIRDGFALFAFLFTFLWFLWNRLWLMALLFLAVFAASNWLTTSEEWSAVGYALSLAASVLAGLEGPNMRVEKLLGKGWRQVAVIAADDRETAEAIHLPRRPEEIGAPLEAAEPGTREPETMLIDAEGGSFGLFEWNGRR